MGLPKAQQRPLGEMAYGIWGHAQSTPLRGTVDPFILLLPCHERGGGREHGHCLAGLSFPPQEEGWGGLRLRVQACGCGNR